MRPVFPNLAGVVTARHVRSAQRVLIAAAFSSSFLLFPTRSQSQVDGDPVTVGTYRVLASEILGEDRVLQVHLPRGYDSTAVSYPVVFVFYSDWVQGYYAELVNDLYHLSIDRMPPAILVGIPNTQRYRDLLPWPRPGGQPGDGQADRFLRFVREELIPFMDREYRTKPYRIMVGPQAAGIFGIYTLLEAPGTFQAFLLNNPCLADHPGRSLCRELVEFARAPEARGVFFAVTDRAGAGREPAPLEVLRSELGSLRDTALRWRIWLVSDWPFFLAPVGPREALLDLFEGYPFPVPEEAAGLAEIRAHYNRVSAGLGFDVEPPDLVLTLAANAMMNRGTHADAMETFNHLVERYPFSMNGPWGLANLYRTMGDTATAIRYYEECLRRDPDMNPAREWLRRLRGGGDQPQLKPREDERE